MDVRTEEYDSDVQLLPEPEVLRCSQNDLARLEPNNNHASNSGTILSENTRHNRSRKRPLVKDVSSDDEFVPKHSPKFVDKSANAKEKNTVIVCDSSGSDDELIRKRSTKFADQSANKENTIAILTDSSGSDDELIRKRSTKFADQSANKENTIVILTDSSDSGEDASGNKWGYAVASTTNGEPSRTRLDPKASKNSELVIRQEYLESEVARLKKLRALKAKIPRPDVDEKMRKKIIAAERRLKKFMDEFAPAQPGPSRNGAKPAPLFKENSLEIDPAYLLPKTDQHRSEFGKTAQVTLNREQSVTMERLQDLHGSLVDRPTEDELAEDPPGLKIPLMRHQKHALAWMLWRECQNPRGGILADDMGLGKTLSMIALVLASARKAAREVNDDEDEWKSSERIYRNRGGTLVVVPKSLISQWGSEVKKRCKRGELTVERYHGTDRNTSQAALSRNDIVLTSYGMVVQSFKSEGILHNIRWRRIILDEAHTIRNHKSQSCEAVCDLVAETRWALTGTPIQNKIMDVFAILKFLQCSPFDDVRVWKRWIDKASTAGQQRLEKILQVLMLRRTKKELQATREIDSLPDKSIEDIDVALDPEERLVYDKVMVYSRSMFAKFLAQKAEKARAAGLDDDIGWMSTFDGTEFTEAQHKILSMHADVNSIVILVVLLRLRQLCCHPWLINVMLDRDDIVEAGGSEIDDDNIMSEINKIGIECIDEDTGVDRRVTEQLLTSDNPVFDRKRQSSKMRAVLAKVAEILATGDKQIVVSQWTTVIDLLADELESVKGASFRKFTGKMTMPQRERILHEFNSPQSKPNILLLSLKAGGVGLNLVGANHLLLIDIHWNPQLERQAQDRIYRLGQTKDIHIYKFLYPEVLAIPPHCSETYAKRTPFARTTLRYICTDTIEEQIKALQNKKLRLASALLSPNGKRAVGSNKLSLDDLRMLFGV